jgi:hypothetical protein
MRMCGEKYTGLVFRASRNCHKQAVKLNLFLPFYMKGPSESLKKKDGG